MQKFGWIAPEERTPEQQALHAEAVAEMPSWELVGDDWGTTKACLWDFTRKAYGKDIPCLYQETGSCVGNGAWNAVMYLMAFEIARLGQPEEMKLIFMPYHYGRGRFYGGFRGRGSGSNGGPQAKAVRVDGVIAQELEGLPATKQKAGMTWGAAVEYEWSAGERIGEKWIEQGKLHPVKSTAQVRNAADVKAAICNGYPVTIASNWGGRMSPRVRDGVLLNDHVDTWGHMMSVLAWWKHPTLGGIFWIQNSWGTETHGRCPSGAPGGGFWVLAKDIDFICDQGDSFAYSQFDGFPRQEISWDLV